jgi:hypothetical protein
MDTGAGAPSSTRSSRSSRHIEKVEWSVGASPIGPRRLPPFFWQAPTFVTNIPVASPDLIGRETAAEHLRELLSAHRIVTLTESGGIGKTVLALNVASSLFPSFDGTVWLSNWSRCRIPR